MGRSVNYLDNAETVIYFTADWLNEVDEKGNYDEFLSQLNWEDFERNLKSAITGKLKSYSSCEDWDNRETKIILRNELCNIGISEYCGLYSLSVAPIDYDGYYPCEVAKINFSKNHAWQIKKTLCKVLQNLGCEVLNRVGTFSNGCGVFEKAKV
jgi:hypothetical protein